MLVSFTFEIVQVTMGHMLASLDIDIFTLCFINNCACERKWEVFHLCISSEP